MADNYLETDKMNNIHNEEIYKEDGSNSNTEKYSTIPVLNNQSQEHRISCDNEPVTTSVMVNSEEKFYPPDGGWGWVVAAGCFSITTLTSMIGPCFGVLFSRYLLGLNTSSTTTAWIFNSFLCLWNAIGVFVKPLIQEYGWRQVGFVGALINVAAFVTTAFSPSAEFLFFSFSLLCGVGGGAMGYICFTILPHFFYKRRGISNSIMMAGVCMGQFVGPPIIRYLQDEYSFKGATLIIGAVMLNACVGVSVFHPAKWHMKRATNNMTEPLSKRSNTILFQNHLPINGTKGLVKSQSGISLGESIGGVEIELSGSIPRTGKLSRYSDCDMSKEVSGFSTCSRKRDTLISSTNEKKLERLMTEAELAKNNIVQKKQPWFKKLWSGLKNIFMSILSDLSQITSPKTAIVCFGAIFCVNGYLNFIMMVPFAMQAAGHSLQSSAWCVSISAVTNLLARLSSSCLSDWSKFNVKVCYMAGLLLMALTMLTFPFVIDDVRSLMIVMGLWGCGVGASMGVYNLVIIAIVGLENLASVFGTASFMVAIGFILSGPLIGYIRDASGSYAVSVWVLAAMAFSSFILWLFMPIAITYEKRKSTKGKDTL